MQNPPPTSPFDYDAALMACARGDRQALQQLYQRESRYLMGVARTSDELERITARLPAAEVALSR